MSSAGSHRLTHLLHSSLGFSLLHISLDQVCTLALRQGIKCGTLDQALIGLFGEGWPIPTRAFESLFGVFEQGSTKSCRYELPTLLHLAAKFGLQELASQLLDLPGSSLANAIPNASNQYPNDLAKDKSPDLAAFLKEAKDSVRSPLCSPSSVLSSCDSFAAGARGQ